MRSDGRRLLITQARRRYHVARVFVSSLVRARRTTELAGIGAAAEVVPDLAEWDYGSCEGRQTAETGAESRLVLFRDGAPGGDSMADVRAGR